VGSWQTDLTDHQLSPNPHPRQLGGDLRTSVALGTGSGWVENDFFEPPTCFVDDLGKDKGVKLSDVNGDGLVDILKGLDTGTCSDDDRKAWINNGSNWVEDDSWQPPDCFIDSNANDFGTRLWLAVRVRLNVLVEHSVCHCLPEKNSFKKVLVANLLLVE